MENDNLREETKEEVTSSQEETQEEETSSQEEIQEEETSSQEETQEEETSSQEETQEEESSESYFNPDFNRDQEHYEELIQTSSDSIDSYDYTSYFENLQSLGIIITAFILGLGLSLAFALGFKRD